MFSEHDRQQQQQQKSYTLSFRRPTPTIFIDRMYDVWYETKWQQARNKTL